MKNIVVTVIVFSFIFIVILGGAFVFQKVHVLDTIKEADQTINEDIQKVMNGNTDKQETPVSETEPVEEPAKENQDTPIIDNNTQENIISDNITQDNNSMDNSSTVMPNDNDTDTTEEIKEDNNTNPQPESSLNGGMVIYSPSYLLADSKDGKSIGNAFEEFVEEDPFGKSIKNLGKELKKDAEKIKKQLDNASKDQEKEEEKKD